MNRDYRSYLDELEHSYKHSTFEVFPDTEALWFPENKTLILRGTDSIIDWAFNLLAFPEGMLGFHYGFAYKGDRLLDEMERLGISPTLIVGHSAGGALAQYCGYNLDCEVYSIATPPTIMRDGLFTNDFYLWADEKLVIVNQKKDLVSYLPPWGIHPIEPLWLTSEEFPLFAHTLMAFE